MSIAPFRRPAAGPDRRFIAALALDPENLPRALAAMGFNERVACVARGDMKWWQPDYCRLPADSLDRARRGDAQAARFIASRRADLGAINRGMAAASVHVMRRAEPERVICLDADTGEWRSPDNAVRGDDLVALASLMWAVGLGHACHKLARACGHAEAPLAHVG
jgi:hypothetical protein